MKSFWLFRSNIRHLEYYHEYKDLQTFKNKCHDYYLLLPLWLLENDYFDEVIIWRLSDTVKPDIVFNINGKKYYQRWVRNFIQTLKYASPDISFWRGGFKEYDDMTRFHLEHFGFKLYLGAGRRIFPQWNGNYNVFLLEDRSDFVKNLNCIPFYKTASPEIFKPLGIKQKKYDICWPCNFEQIKYKGQKLFLNTVASCPYLKSLKIVHCGNKQEVGKQMCKNLNIHNIEFLGHISREKLNEVLNQSKFGLNLSNEQDGCPRVSTEILMSGTPLIIRNTTRLLPYFKKKGVVEVTGDNIIRKISFAMKNYSKLLTEVLEATQTDLSFENINKKNIDLWLDIKNGGTPSPISGS